MDDFRISQLETTLNEQAQLIESLKLELQETKGVLSDLISNYSEHSHSGVDSTKRISIQTPNDLQVGVAFVDSFERYSDSTGQLEEAIAYIVAGKENPDSNTRFPSTQLALIHQPLTNGTTNQSFYIGQRPPFFATDKGITISVTSGGTTVVDNSKNFITNELAGAYINVYNSSKTYMFSRVISSNTYNTITITGTWPSTVTGGTYLIYMPVYLGSADTPWRRLYVLEGSSGGIRFGTGPTDGGENGMLYMASDGHLIWRNLVSSTILLDVFVSTQSGTSSGTGTVKMNGITNRDSNGWIEVNKPGGGTGYVPVWNTITG